MMKKSPKRITKHSLNSERKERRRQKKPLELLLRSWHLAREKVKKRKTRIEQIFLL